MSMWNEREMPERWYELLRERLKVEEERQRIFFGLRRDEPGVRGELLRKARRLEGEMRGVMARLVGDVPDWLTGRNVVPLRPTSVEPLP
jgi:hypothetical protein